MSLAAAGGAAPVGNLPGRRVHHGDERHEIFPGTRPPERPHHRMPEASSRSLRGEPVLVAEDTEGISVASRTKRAPGSRCKGA